MGVVKIENNTAAWIRLFPTDSFPVGVGLGPGLNSVPELFLEEFRARSVKTEIRDSKGAYKVIYPGVDALEDLQKTVRFVTPDGVRVGPRITIYTDDQAGRADGPIPPHDLRGYTEEQALVAIKMMTEMPVLKRWAVDNRKAVKAAVMAKLAMENG